MGSSSLFIPCGRPQRCDDELRHAVRASVRQVSGRPGASAEAGVEIQRVTNPDQGRLWFHKILKFAGAVYGLIRYGCTDLLKRWGLELANRNSAFSSIPTS